MGSDGVHNHNGLSQLDKEQEAVREIKDDKQRSTGKKNKEPRLKTEGASSLSLGVLDSEMQ